jgi:hypothetical protein
MSIVVNLFGGPGSTKSTNALGITYFLKLYCIEAELANEYAKEKVYDNSLEILEDQNYVFAKQLHKMRRVDGKVDVIVSDSPLVLSILYNKNESEEFVQNVLKTFNAFDNMNFYIERPSYYTEAGRLQTKEEAMALDEELKKILKDNDIPYTTIKVDDNDREYVARTIYDIVYCELRKRVQKTIESLYKSN